MAAAAVVKIDANTSAFSAKMNQARAKVGGIAKGAQEALGPFGAIATKAGIIATAGVVATREWKMWLDLVKEGNRVSAEIAKNAQNIASGVGAPQSGPLIQGAIERSALQGGGSIAQVTSGLQAFTGTAPDATPQQINRAGENFQGFISGGLSPQDATVAMEMAGRMITAGVSPDRAFGLAMYLNQKLGKDASRAVMLLPRLLASGIDERDAIAMAIAGARVGDRAGAATVVEAFIDSGGRGGSRALSAALTRENKSLGDQFSVFQQQAQGVDFGGYVAQQGSMLAATNPEYVANLSLQRDRNEIELLKARNGGAAGFEQEKQAVAAELLRLREGRSGTVANLASGLVSRFSITEENAIPNAVAEFENARYQNSQYFGKEAEMRLMRQQRDNIEAIVREKQRFNTGNQD